MSSGVASSSAESQGEVSSAIFPLLRQSFGPSDILVLCLFVAAAKQDDESLATPGKIDTISRTVIDPHFADAFADRRSIARVAERQAIDSDLYPRPRPYVSQVAQPFQEDRGAANFGHRT